MEASVEQVRELITATKHALQLVDAHILDLKRGRVPLQPADDVNSEHKPAWLGAVDDDTELPLTQAGLPLPGIVIGTGGVATTYGWNNPKTGKIRNQEDAAFVCTDILVAVATNFVLGIGAIQPWLQMAEHVTDLNSINLFMQLKDGNTGRNLTEGVSFGSQLAGMNSAPSEPDRGMIPFSYFSSVRPGLGANVKNRLFSEFTIPRAGVVEVEIYNFAGNTGQAGQQTGQIRAFVSLLGYRVYGG